MEDFKEEWSLERSSTSRPLNDGGVIAASDNSFDLIASGTSRAEELNEDEKRSFRTRIKTNRRPNQGDESLREWLDKPGRLVDFIECLHIFRQVVEAVNLAHSQGVVVNNIRPSCFVMSTGFNSVSFIESASCSGSDSDSSYGEEGGSSCGAENRLIIGEGMSSLVKEMEGKGELGEVSGVEERRDFPLKKLLSMEFNWYRSPEEAQERQSLFASDVYKLGVLLFELFCMFETLEEKLGIMSNLRHRVLPPQMLIKWPKVASFCLWLLHPQPSSRPKMRKRRISAVIFDCCSKSHPSHWFPCHLAFELMREFHRCSPSISLQILMSRKFLILLKEKQTSKDSFIFSSEISIHGSWEGYLSLRCFLFCSLDRACTRKEFSYIDQYSPRASHLLIADDVKASKVTFAPLNLSSTILKATLVYLVMPPRVKLPFLITPPCNDVGHISNMI